MAAMAMARLRFDRCNFSIIVIIHGRTRKRRRHSQCVRFPALHSHNSGRFAGEKVGAADGSEYFHGRWFAVREKQRKSPLVRESE
jgi:hypothetical protein